MASILLSILFLMTLGTFFIFGFFRFFSNFNPSDKRVVKDLATLREEIKEWIANLVPWSAEERDLLSFSQIEQTAKTGFFKSAKGIFISVYHEPLLAYNYKQYYSRKTPNALLIAHTSAHEFAYRIKNKEIHINIDNAFVGTLKENGCVYGGEENHLIARMNKVEGEKLYPILVGDKEIASMVNRPKANVANPRVFKLMATVTEEEEKLMMALAVLEMVQESL